jgi:hypothetical protein
MKLATFWHVETPKMYKDGAQLFVTQTHVYTRKHRVHSSRYSGQGLIQWLNTWAGIAQSDPQNILTYIHTYKLSQFILSPGTTPLLRIRKCFRQDLCGFKGDTWCERQLFVSFVLYQISRSFSLFSLLSYFEKQSRLMSSRCCLCVSPLLLLGNGSVKVPLSLLGNGSVKIQLSLLGNDSVRSKFP